MSVSPEILVERFQADPSNENWLKIVEHFKKMIYQQVMKFRNLYVAEADLYVEGEKGLWIASKRFQSGKKLKFSTYAMPYISGAIKKIIRDSSTLIHRPAWIQELKHSEGEEAVLSRTGVAYSTFFPVSSDLVNKNDQIEIDNQYSHKNYRTRKINDLQRGSYAHLLDIYDEASLLVGQGASILQLSRHFKIDLDKAETLRDGVLAING